MKKILFSAVAAAAMLVSCTKFVYDEPIKFIEAETPEVTAKAVSDSAISVTVVPKQSTSFYSYIVAEGRAAKLDSVSLLKNVYKSGALKVGDNTYCGVIEFAKQATVSINISGLVPNTYYTIYAVANNAQGKVSSVATATCLTTDGTAPILQDFYSQEQDGVLAFGIEFDDPVQVGTGKVTAHYYAAYVKSAQGVLTEQKSFEVPADSVFTYANVLYVYLPASEYVPGAYVTLSYTEGTVTNELGAPCAAFDDENYYAMLYSSKNGYYSYGIYDQYAPVKFKLSLNPEGDAEEEDDPLAGGDDDSEEEEAAPEVFTDWTELVMKSYAQTEYPLVGRKITTAAISVVDGNGRTVSYTGQQLVIVDKAEGVVGVALDEDPGFGSYVSYTIAADSILDIYGNSNDAFSVTKGYFCSYGYTVADIVGSYSVSAVNAYTGKAVTTTFAVAESDDAKKGNIVITNYLGLPTKLYATFDLDSGYFALKSGAGLYQASNGNIYATDFYEDKSAVFNVPKAGSITCSDYYVGAYVYGSDGSELGYYLLSYDFVATRQ